MANTMSRPPLRAQPKSRDQLPRRSGKTSRDDLARSESAIVGTLLANWPGVLPLTITRLIANAPDSFSDLRPGLTTVAMRQLANAGDPVNILSVEKWLTDKCPDFSMPREFLRDVIRNEVPLEAAESEAGPLWDAFRLRKLAVIGEAMTTALAAAPYQWRDIAATSRAALDAITEDAPPSSVSIDERIAGLWFDPHEPPPDEPVLVTIAGIPCATLGNITTITAQKKTGKTALISAIAASAISEQGDTLGVKAFNRDNKTVLHFDTEQSAMDHWKLCDSILRRAQLKEAAIFKSVCLTSLPILGRQAIVHHIIKQEAQRGNGVFIALIDGHGDLVRNVNDPVESADYVAALHALAIETHCHIYGALHLNPGSDFKSRGHLGSELERKSQTNLRLEKDGEKFCVWGDANRGAPIPKNAGPCFVWDKEARMHVSVASHRQTKSDIQLENARMKVAEAFRLADKSALHYSELIAGIQRVPGIKSDTTAERIFRTAKDAGYISKNLLNQWQITQ